MRGQAAVVAILLGLSGCDADRATRDYVNNIQSLSAPIDHDGRVEACQGLDAELADQQAREDEAQRLAPLFAADARRQFGERIDALNQKKEADDCFQPDAAPVASSIVVPAAPSASSPIEQCVAACKANTSRSSAQCFDACNHH